MEGRPGHTLQANHTLTEMHVSASKNFSREELIIDCVNINSILLVKTVDNV